MTEQHMYTEDEARSLLTVAAEDIRPGTDLQGDLLRGLRKRQATRRIRTRAAVATGTAGALAAGALTALSMSAAPSALAAVTAAATRTAGQSFVYTGTMTRSVRSSDPSGAQPPYTVTVTGKLAPARGEGEENGGSVRFLNGYEYIRTAVLHMHIPGKSWIRWPGPLPPHDAFAGILSSDPVALVQMSPQDLLPLLKDATSVRQAGTASGPGWTGTAYTFSGTELGNILVRGTVDVDEHGRIRQLDTTASWASEDGTSVITSRIMFGGFGTAVSVSAPPASEVFTSPGGPAIPWSGIVP
jgi:hypothetical protein